MVLAVCIDDSNGLMFNNRRLSSDKAVVRDMLQIAGTAITVNPYSAPLFQGFEDCIVVKEDHLSSKRDFCFAEFGDFLEIMDTVDTLIVYKWNRRYPSDTKFPLDAFKGRLTLDKAEDIEGSSHPCISREVYVR